MRLNKLALGILTGIAVSHYPALAEETEALDTIVVSGDDQENVLEKKVGETQINSTRLTKQQVSDSRDLVRYETGITVVETGRMGSSGYAVRGVDENRVGIMIDGLRQAETLSSQGFKELFEGYGNFNNTRNGAEIENVRMATITKGADSIKSGSGALGGSVLFETKDARDYLTEKDWHVGLKRGYQSSDNQDILSATLAGRYKWFDLLFIKTRREGHELENYFYDIYKNKEEDFSAVGETREKADPYSIRRDSTLVKFGIQPTDDHRFSVMLDDSKIHSDGDDLSYSFRISNFLDSYRRGERKTHDKSHRRNVQFAYETFTQTPFWDHAKVAYSSQKITNNARTDEFCDGPQCISILNPAGLHLDDSSGTYKTLDKDNGEIKAEKDGWYDTYLNSKGENIDDGVALFPVERTYIDCTKLDCSKPFDVLVRSDENWNNVYAFQARPIVRKSIGGKEYGVIERKYKEVESWLGGKTKQYEDLSFAFPKSAGYSRDDFNDRDLNTDTKQINLDFDKEFSTWNVEHLLKYGGLYSKTDKSMVNKDGYRGMNVQWWADNFFCATQNIDNYPDITYDPRPDNWPTGSCGGNLRENTNNIFSYLIPVKTKNTALYLSDNITLTNWLNLDLNYRYDKIKHKPRYNTNVPVPKGMIAGIFVPLPGNAYGTNAECGYNTECMDNNVAENLSILLKNKTYKHHSYNIGLNFDPLDWMRFQVKYSNGFRAPTSDEMFMTFKHPSFSIAPNSELKPEIAKTKELALTFYKDQSFVTFSAFQTDYDNFIDLVFAGERPVDVGSAINYPFYQNQNRDSAKVKGIEINSRLNLGDVYSTLNGFRLGYKLTYQKGRVKGVDLDDQVRDLPMNAIQPTTMVYNVGYSTQDDKYGIDFFITNVAEKKRGDTYNMYWKTQQGNGSLVKGEPVTDNKLSYRNKRYTTIDAIAYARPIKNLLVTAGVYNLTDEKYVTWDSARSIRAIGTVNRIDQNTGAGFKRFYAPGRNFRVNAELTF
ncbi:TonB-dependent receptor domain-containing protein [Otariodibacter oris]|uniref:Hemoglobin/transferrin/lactoferrin receptor protein n=1 Tax=Otariodibacter oris TaxID=1032623 RepID=A0A420XER5_9PAST|nr:TonB-dependent receptor [Otariodibacter oris]QGM81375.1 TonB-dependent receptor [Otariodibacter oris]RKR70813.1 hemoglobin/transferrin/lactoferrin receptor protein [Otariodibacter oris]